MKNGDRDLFEQVRKQKCGFNKNVSIFFMVSEIFIQKLSNSI